MTRIWGIAYAIDHETNYITFIHGPSRPARTLKDVSGRLCDWLAKTVNNMSQANQGSVEAYWWGWIWRRKNYPGWLSWTIAGAGEHSGECPARQ
ncbi:MAG TPA: hypothetical protein VMW24_24875 [Sedimentisphaerales bacterium]|nr:hypothetical protein [Sedimentisphaerales bacterium]